MYGSYETKVFRKTEKCIYDKYVRHPVPHSNSGLQPSCNNNSFLRNIECFVTLSLLTERRIGMKYQKNLQESNDLKSVPTSKLAIEGV